jgi:predicted Zn-dependent protease
VRRVGQRIERAVAIEPLQREINLHLHGYTFAWEYNVLASKQINAFCLPGGKVGVYSGLLPVTANDDQLATVMGHEIAHALAHHASERLAREQKLQEAVAVVNGTGVLDRRLIGWRRAKRMTRVGSRRPIDHSTLHEGVERCGPGFPFREVVP